jgi:hypothetical protein
MAERDRRTSIAGVNNDVQLTRDSPFANTPFDDFMRKIVAHLMTMPMVRRIGSIEYTPDRKVAKNVLIWPQIPPNPDPKKRKAALDAKSQETADRVAIESGPRPDVTPSASALEAQKRKDARIAEALLKIEKDVSGKRAVDILSMKVDFSVDAGTLREKMARIAALVDMNSELKGGWDVKLAHIINLGTFDKPSGDYNDIMDTPYYSQLLILGLHKEDPELINAAVMTQLKSVRSMWDRCRSKDVKTCWDEWSKQQHGGARATPVPQSGGAWGYEEDDGGPPVHGGGGDDDLEFSVLGKWADDILILDAAPSVHNSRTLRDAYRISMVRDLLQRMKGGEGGNNDRVHDAIERLAKWPFPHATKNDDFRTLVSTTYQYNVNPATIKTIKAGAASASNDEVQVKMLWLKVNQGEKSQNETRSEPLLWLSDVSGNIFASIEAAWGSVENSERSVALEQYFIGRICQFLAESYAYDTTVRKYVKQEVELKNKFRIPCAERSFVMFADLYGSRSGGMHPSGEFERLATGMQRAAKRGGGLFTVDITAGKRVVASVAFARPVKIELSELQSSPRNFLRKKGRACCDDNNNNGGDASRSSTRQQMATKLQLEFGKYDSVFAPIIMLVFLMYVTGMANQLAFPPSQAVAKELPVITQSMLAAILAGFKTPLEQYPMVSPLPDFRKI